MNIESPPIDAIIPFGRSGLVYITYSPLPPPPPLSHVPPPPPHPHHLTWPKKPKKHSYPSKSQTCWCSMGRLVNLEPCCSRESMVAPETQGIILARDEVLRLVRRYKSSCSSVQVLQKTYNGEYAIHWGMAAGFLLLTSRHGASWRHCAGHSDTMGMVVVH